jgi:hypothetical protein
LVRMRTRKPWVRFRLRLFGWNVRFMLSPGRLVSDPQRDASTGQKSECSGGCPGVSIRPPRRGLPCLVSTSPGVIA